MFRTATGQLKKRRGEFKNLARKDVDFGETLPSPVGGLNVKDSIAAMPPTDALYLSNFIPQPYGCISRRGYRNVSSSDIQFVQDEASLAVWSSSITDILSKNDSVIVLAESNPVTLIDATGAHSILTNSRTGLVVNLTSGRWDHIQYVNSGGTWTVTVNQLGLDAPMVYNGTVLWTLISGDGVAPYTIAGVDPADFIGVANYKGRLFFVEKESTRAWYLPVSTVYGTALSFDFGSQFSRGGALAALFTWTIDAGEGSDDLFVAVSTNGEVAVYTGTNPADAAAWRLVGNFYIGRPLAGQRAFTKYGGDVVCLTEYGVVQLSQALTSTDLNGTQNILSDKIQLLFSELSLGNSALYYGWGIVNFPSQNLLLVNVPQPDGTTFQLVMNTVTKGWCRFDNIKTPHWVVVNGLLHLYGKPVNDPTVFYRVSDFGVAVADHQLNDYSDGIDIVAEGQQAFNYFERYGRNKHFKMFRPTFNADGPFGLSAQFRQEYDISPILTTDTAVPTSAGLWDSALWDVGLWGGFTLTRQNWLSAEGTGYSGSIRVKVSGQAQVLWISTDFILEEGGRI